MTGAAAHVGGIWRTKMPGGIRRTSLAPGPATRFASVDQGFPQESAELHDPASRSANSSIALSGPSALRRDQLVSQLRGQAGPRELPWGTEDGNRSRCDASEVGDIPEESMGIDMAGSLPPVQA